MSDSIAAFFSAWGDPNPETRARSLRDCVGDSIFYADPRTPEPITDTAALNHYIGMYSQHSPGATAHVAALSKTGTSHRATVAFVMANGAGQHGQYFIELDKTGRLARLTGFAGLGEPE